MKNDIKQTIGMAMSIPTEKICKTCPEIGMQPLSAFSRVPSATDGHSGKCRQCQREDSKTRMEAKKAEQKMYGFERQLVGLRKF